MKVAFLFKNGLEVFREIPTPLYKIWRTPLHKKNTDPLTMAKEAEESGLPAPKLEYKTFELSTVKITPKNELGDDYPNVVGLPIKAYIEV